MDTGMKFLHSFRVWLTLLVLLALPACGERGASPDLARVLTSSWQSYRQQFISPDGRVVIPERDGGTISEAQAYALLRAVWAGDEATFARVYAWTRNNLSRPDHLLSWHWGRRPDGSWGVLDANTASDGDLDYALALVLAARRGWRAPPGQPDYLSEAREVAAGILAQEVVALPGGALLLTPGNWHEPGPPYLFNPSYCSPAAYRLFSQISHERKNVEQPPPAVSNQAGGTGVPPVRRRLNAHGRSQSPAGDENPPYPPFSKGVLKSPFSKGGIILSWDLC